MCGFICWIVYICLLFNGVCGAVTSWNMHDVCGAEISRYAFAGEVTFDAKQLPSHHEKGGMCTLTITPETLGQSEDNMVMFYFTTFEFSPICSVMNVTLWDGRRGSDKIVQGLPRHLCGTNSTLTKQVLSTSGESLYIEVHMKSLRESLINGIFVLKFITYHTGSCHGDSSSEVHECSNGHCIPQVYTNCSENIKACGGEVNDECAEESEEESLADWFGQLLRSILIFVACICVFCLLKTMLKKGKKKCEEGAGCFPSCLRDLRIKCRNCTNSIKLSRFPKPRLPDFIRSRLRSNNSEMTDETINVRDTAVTSDAVTNPAFSSSNDQIDQVTLPPAPPFTVMPLEITSHSDLPSYEEVMASSSHSVSSLHTNEYEHTPVYVEIMSSNIDTPPPRIDTPPPLQYDEYSLYSEVDVSDTTNETPASHTDIVDEADERIMTSNQIIQSSLQTDNESILNNYLSHFGVELSDGYSTDPDWEADSISSVTLSEQTLESVSNVNIAVEEDNPVSPPSYDDAVPPPYYYDYIANVGRYRQDSDV